MGTATSKSATPIKESARTVLSRRNKKGIDVEKLKVTVDNVKSSPSVVDTSPSSTPYLVDLENIKKSQDVGAENDDPAALDPAIVQKMSKWSVVTSQKVSN